MGGFPASKDSFASWPHGALLSLPKKKVKSCKCSIAQTKNLVLGHSGNLKLTVAKVIKTLKETVYDQFTHIHTTQDISEWLDADHIFTGQNPRVVLPMQPPYPLLLLQLSATSVALPFMSLQLLPNPTLPLVLLPPSLWPTVRPLPLPLLLLLL